MNRWFVHKVNYRKWRTTRRTVEFGPASFQTLINLCALEFKNNNTDNDDGDDDDDDYDDDNNDNDPDYDGGVGHDDDADIDDRN